MSSASVSPSYTSAKSHKRALRFVSQVQARVMAYFRVRRHRWLAEEFGDCRTVIDIGGRESMWYTVAFSPQVTIVNPEPAGIVQPGFDYVAGDGRALTFAGASFELAFSNSVIEHVGSFEDQQRFAREMLRVGRRVYCQTPNRWFPVEFHFLGLFVHWLPRNWFTYFVHRRMTLRGILGKPTREQSQELRGSIRLLSRRELVELFPGCKIRTERFLGMSKSFVVWR
jgi:SAM-dependent methyltransferase